MNGETIIMKAKDSKMFFAFFSFLLSRPFFIVKTVKTAYNKGKNMIGKVYMNLTKRKFQWNPSRVILGSFILLILIGGLLLNLPFATVSGKSAGLLTSFFTSVSAVCVTGLVVVDTGTFWSPVGQGIILLLIQLGGLGFVTLVTGFFAMIGRRLTLRDRLIAQESVGNDGIKGLLSLTKKVVAITLLIELIGAVLLSFRLIPDYGFAKGTLFSIFHSVSAFCNAGFDLFGQSASLMNYSGDLYMNIIIMSLIIIGGIGFVVIFDIFKKKHFKKLSMHSKLVLRFTLFLIVVPAILFFLLESGNTATMGDLSMGEKGLTSFFQSVTCRTAGFNTLPIGELTKGSQLLSILLMFIGGSPGSIAGGIKTITFLIVILYIIQVFTGRSQLVIYKKSISRQTIERATIICILGFFMIFVFSFMITTIEGEISFIEVLFEVVSAFGTVGLSTGITGSLSAMSQVLLMMTMFMGRVGIFTIGVGLLNKTQKTDVIQYVDEKIMVG